jgi:hypothetical protein
MVKLELIKLKLTSCTHVLYIVKGLCNGNLLKDFHEVHHLRNLPKWFTKYPLGMKKECWCMRCIFVMGEIGHW